MQKKTNIFGRFGLKNNVFVRIGVGGGGCRFSVDFGWTNHVFVRIGVRGGGRFLVDFDWKNNVFVRIRVGGGRFLVDFSIFGFRTPFRFFVCSFVCSFVRSVVFSFLRLVLSRVVVLHVGVTFEQRHELTCILMGTLNVVLILYFHTINVINVQSTYN